MKACFAVALVLSSWHVAAAAQSAHHHHTHGHHGSHGYVPPEPEMPMPHRHGFHAGHDAHAEQHRPAPDALAAAFPDLHGVAVHTGSHTAWKISLDRLEHQQSGGTQALAWRGQAWWGNDIDRVHLHSRGDRRAGSHRLETGLYWQRLITPWWETRLGMKQEHGHGPQRVWLVMGLEGRTPWFVDAAASLAWGENGQAELKLESGYDWRFTQRLLLRADVELRFRNHDDVEAGLAKGFSEAEAGLRLRHEVHRRFAPYVGVAWVLRPGDSGQPGHDRESHRLVAGLRFWF